MMINGRRAIAFALIVVLLGGCGQSRPSGSGVHFSSDVFAYNARYGVSNEQIVVRGNFTRAAGVAALRRAATRLFLVDENGVEHRDERGFPPRDEHGRELYTPNYVSDPTVVARGVQLYVDCKGAIEPAMRARFLRILTDELRDLGNVRVSSVT
jgi:hypothetical protein